MTLNYPSRIRLDLLIGGALVLLLSQLASGTEQVFAELVFVFVVLSGITVNLLGGLNTLGGLCVAAMSLKMVIISQIAKVILWQPAHERLETPLETITVLLVGMTGICLAAALTAPVKFRRNLLTTQVDAEALQALSIVLTVVGVAVMFGCVLLGGGEEGGLRVGGVVGVLRQFSFCLGFSIGVGTAYTIVASNGKRLFSIFNAVPFFVSFIFGVLYASKEGMFAPFLYLALAACAFKFTVRGVHLVLFLGVALVATFIFYPFAQLARNEVRGYGFKDTIKESGRFMTEHFSSWDGFQEMLSPDANGSPEQDYYNYYRKPVGLLERMSLIKMADLLTATTLRQGASGWETVTHGFKMMVPRLIYPQKPIWNTGEILAQRVGMLAEDDESTQVSFGFIPDAFSAFGWWGAAIIPCLLCVGFFLVYKYLLGTLRQSIWGIFFAAQLQHAFTEATIASMTLTMLYTPLMYVALHLALNWAARSAVARSILQGPLKNLALRGCPQLIPRQPHGLSAVPVARPPFPV